MLWGDPKRRGRDGLDVRKAGPRRSTGSRSLRGLGDQQIFFGQLTDKAIRRGIFHSVPDLIDAIESYLAKHNENPQPF